MLDGDLKTPGDLKNWCVQLSKLRPTLRRVKREQLQEGMDPSAYENLKNYWRSGDWREKPQRMG